MLHNLTILFLPKDIFKEKLLSQAEQINSQQLQIQIFLQ